MCLLETVEFLAIAKEIAHYHHEKWDGSGYPDGLKGEDIPLAARIISIADCFDALTTDRPYRKGLSGEAAISEMENSMGGQFDPAILRVFAEAWNRKKREAAETELKP